MDKEMAARLRSGAAIRKTGCHTRSSVNILGICGDTNPRISVTYVKQITTSMNVLDSKQ